MDWDLVWQLKGHNNSGDMCWRVCFLCNLHWVFLTTSINNLALYLSRIFLFFDNCGYLNQFAHTSTNFMGS